METAVIQSDANLYKARVSLKTYCSSQLFFWREYHTVRQSKARERDQFDVSKFSNSSQYTKNLQPL